MDDYNKGFAEIAAKLGFTQQPSGVTIPLADVSATWTNGHGTPTHDNCGASKHALMMPLDPDTWICATCRGTITDVDAALAVERHRAFSEQQFKKQFGDAEGAKWAEVFLGVKR